MRERTLFEINMPYRETLKVRGYEFGGTEQSICIVGPMRGNEVQQLFLASQMAKRLKQLEEKGAFVGDCGAMVIPCVNHASINLGKRFWSVDSTDINRMFPGYDKGETTQRIAAELFDAVRNYTYGIQFPSFYLEGDFIPHVRYMTESGPGTEAAADFGMRYVVSRKPQPFDTATLNYNWRLFDTDAYSIYSGKTDTIDEPSAQEAQRACLRFMARRDIIDYPCHRGFHSSRIKESQLNNVFTARGGIFRRLVNPGETVSGGSVLAQVLSPLTGEVCEEVCASVGGVVFFACKTPLVTEHTLVFSLVPRGAD